MHVRTYVRATNYIYDDCSFVARSFVRGMQRAAAAAADVETNSLTWTGRINSKDRLRSILAATAAACTFWSSWYMLYCTIVLVFDNRQTEVLR